MGRQASVRGRLSGYYDVEMGHPCMIMQDSDAVLLLLLSAAGVRESAHNSCRATVIVGLLDPPAGWQFLSPCIAFWTVAFDGVSKAVCNQSMFHMPMTGILDIICFLWLACCA